MTLRTSLCGPKGRVLHGAVQAMIEGLGILLTKMTAPPPAPPPALEGMMPPPPQASAGAFPPAMASSSPPSPGLYITITCIV